MPDYKNFDADKLRYLRLLSRSYSNIDTVTSKIIDLKAVLNMPKATEHFVSDIHGEYDSFYHVVNNASGVIKNYIIELFDSELDDFDKSELATVIYYPEEKLRQLKDDGVTTPEWFERTLNNVIEMTRRVGSKYNREKILNAFPKDKAYILQELIFENPENRHKKNYYETLISEIIRLDMAESYIEELAILIKRFAVEHLHVIGDIYDRGDKAEKVMDFLVSHHDSDVQWGNHDITWMGAFTGSYALIANAIRIAARYNNLATLEDGYGINLVPLITFALDVYVDDPCLRFEPKGIATSLEKDIIAKIHKAISIIQFKAEREIIKRHPEFKMEHRIILDDISPDFKKVKLYGRTYDMLDSNFPTMENGLDLTDEECIVMEKLSSSFRNSKKLAEHMKFLSDKGSMYNVFNDNLLFHGCMPLEEDGTLKETTFLGMPLKGKQLLNILDDTVKKAFYIDHRHSHRDYYNDVIWYLWCGEDSPLFGKTKMTTFERYFVSEKETHEEPKNPYYNYRDDEEVMTMILEEFGIKSKIGKIINGHVPVKVMKGESPIKAGGKLIAIDGGFSEAYQKETGIAGYTLISNSYGLLIATHEPFIELEKAIETNYDITSSTEYALKYDNRRKVISTDLGKNIQDRISDLQELLIAYRSGQLKEHDSI